MKTQRVRVTRVWDEWYDVLAHYAIFQYYANLKHAPKHNKVRKWITASRSRRNRYVDKLRKYGSITPNKAKALGRCRYYGASLNISMPEYECHHPFCPYCAGRRMKEWLLRNEHWVRFKQLGIAVHYQQIPENVVLDPGSAKLQTLKLTAVRKALMSKVGRKAVGAHRSRLLVSRGVEGFDYFHQTVVAAQSMGEALLSATSESLRIGGELKIYRESNAGQLAEEFRFCSDYLNLNYDIAQRVISWNKSFRSRTFGR